MDEIVVATTRTKEELAVQASAPKLVAAANEISVWDEDSAAQAADIAKLLSEAIKIAEDERKKIVKPFNDGVKAINARFKKLTNPLNIALASLKGRLLDFRREQDALRRKQAEAAMVAADRSAAPVATAPILPVSKGQFGSVSTRKTWAYRVTDITKVRYELLTVNHQMIMQLISDGVREESGIEIYQEESVVVR